MKLNWIITVGDLMAIGLTIPLNTVVANLAVYTITVDPVTESDLVGTWARNYTLDDTENPLRRLYFRLDEDGTWAFGIHTRGCSQFVALPETRWKLSPVNSRLGLYTLSFGETASFQIRILGDHQRILIIVNRKEEVVYRCSERASRRD